MCPNFVIARLSEIGSSDSGGAVRSDEELGIERRLSRLVVATARGRLQQQLALPPPVLKRGRSLRHAERGGR